MNDTQIIQLLKENRNDKAFLALYKHFPLIKRMVISKGGKKEDAEDIYQESLLILYRKVNEGSFVLSSKISTYLYSVCRFLWKDELKKRGKIALTEFNEGMNAAEDDGLETIIEEENKAKTAEMVLSELGERCRELLLLFYSGTMKLKEIAEKMGYNSENTAKNQKYKCLEGAKKRLKEIYGNN